MLIEPPPWSGAAPRILFSGGARVNARVGADVLLVDAARRAPTSMGTGGVRQFDVDGTLVGGGALVGSLADTAREAAGVTALGLGLSVVAAGLGGSLGAELWPGRGRRDASTR